MNKNFFEFFKDAIERTKAAQQIADNLALTEDDLRVNPETSTRNFYLNQEILNSLCALSNPLANSYRQIIADFNDKSRISWAGTAHEIRELLRKMLEHLAPDKAVEAELWYQIQPGTTGPTHKQRVKYILSMRKSDTKQRKVTQDIDVIDVRIAELVRDVYGRASDAAHRSKNKAEAFRILRYFEAFSYDLLDLKL